MNLQHVLMNIVVGYNDELGYYAELPGEDALSPVAQSSRCEDVAGCVLALLEQLGFLTPAHYKERLQHYCEGER